MQLSDKTLNLSRTCGYQSIYPFQTSKTIRTISVMKNILAEVNVDEEFERLRYLQLNEFLNAMSLYQDPQLDFKNSYVSIREGKTRSKYFFADPAVIVTPPDKSITLPSEDVSFELNTQQLDKLLKLLQSTVFPIFL